MIKVTNPDGRSFNVRLVRRGECYGRDDCLTHEKPDPMVEFYDATYEGEKFGPRGQFVSRYYLSTLLERDQDWESLSLNGGVSVWWLSAANVNQAIGYARGLLEG